MKMKCVILLAAVCGWLALGGAAKAADDPTISKLIAALKSGDDAARIEAIDALGAKGDKVAEAVKDLTDLLSDKSAEVRAHAVLALGQIGGAAKPSVPAIAELLKDPDPSVRRQVVRALAAIHPGPQVMVPLCVKLLEDADPGIRARVLNAITEAGPAAVPGLIEALKNDKAAYWACLVARDLGPVAKDATPGLIGRLHDERPEVRREAVLALAAIGEDAASAVPELAKLLSDETAAPAATYALGRIGKLTPEIEAKIQANAKSDNKMLSASSLWAMGNLHPQDKTIRTEVTEQLIKLLADNDGYVRTAAARALASLPPAPEITEPIWEKAILSADETTIQYALDALAKMGSKAVPKLMAGLKYDKVRLPILQVLKQIGPDASSATDTLAVLIADKNEDIARAAALALASIGPGAKGAVPALSKALEQKNQPISHALAYALGSIGPDAASAQNVLLGTLSGPDESLAQISAWALTKINPSADVASKVVPVLSKALSSDEPVIRRGAAEALANLGTLAKDAVPALEGALKDQDKSVRDAAGLALTKVRG